MSTTISKFVEFGIGASAIALAAFVIIIMANSASLITYPASGSVGGMYSTVI